MLKKIPPVALNQLKLAHKQLITDSRQQFLNQPVNNNFNFLTLTESSVINELSPVENPKKYSYTLYKYAETEKTLVGEHTAKQFNMFCHGTRKNTNMLYFYPDPAGGSGSPIFYGNIIVSIASGPASLMTGPLLSDGFYNFLRTKMGNDYRQGMCIELLQNAVGGKPIPVIRPHNPK